MLFRFAHASQLIAGLAAQRLNSKPRMRCHALRGLNKKYEDLGGSQNLIQQALSLGFIKALG